MTLVYSGGLPYDVCVVPPEIREAARARSWAALAVSRPGYGRSDPLPGRSVADTAHDLLELCTSLGVQDFMAIGFSAGGPHAVSLGVLGGARRRAVVLLGPLAPPDAAGLDWSAGMPERTALGFDLARRAPEVLRGAPEALLAEENQLAASFARALGQHDAERRPRQAFAQGVRRWLDDIIACGSTRGVSLERPCCSTLVLHGDADENVPLAHGEWLARHLPTARLDVLPGVGHFELLPFLPERVGWIAEAAGG